MEGRERQHKYIQVNGIRLHYVTAGSGPLLLLLHGFAESWSIWRPQIEALSEHYTVVAPDLRGSNDSDTPSWGYEPDVLLSDMIELIAGLGGRQIVVAGHGWGGMLAWAMAMRYPHRVERLIVLNAPHPALIDQAPPWHRSLHRVLAVLLRLPWLPETLLAANDYALLMGLLHGFEEACPTWYQSEIEVCKDVVSKPGVLPAMINWYRFADVRATLREGHPMVPMLREHTSRPIPIPTLLLWSQQDDNEAMGRRTADYVPDLQIATVPACSRHMLLEQPDQVTDLLSDFLAHSQ